MRRATAAGFTALMLVTAASVATAQHAPDSDAEARQHFARAVSLTDDGDFAGAMVEFSRAYELTRNPALLFNLGVVQEGLRHWSEALATLRRFVDEAPPTAVARRRADVDATLARLRERVGTLAITTDLPGLVVQVDGLERTTESARAGLALDVGRHRVHMAAPGHVAREVEIDVTGATRVELRETLARTRSTLAVGCNVPGAYVLIDGNRVATTPAPSPFEVPEGEHRVEVRRSGYTAFATIVNARGVGASVRAELAWATPVPEDQGTRLVLNVTETGAAAFLDERRFSFDGSERVPFGPHRLRVTRRDFLPWEADIDLPAGSVATRSVTLRPTALFRDDYLAGARRARTAAWSVTSVGALFAAAGVVAIIIGADGIGSNEDRQAAVSRSLDACRLGATYCSASQVAQLNAENDALPRDHDQYLAVTGVGIGAAVIGLAAAVTGAVLLRRAPPLDRFSRALSSAPVLAPGRAGITINF